MSTKSITSVSQTQMQQVIMVGRQKIMRDLHAIASKYLSFSRFEVAPAASQKTFWGRDFRVVGAGGIHLIPYSIKDPFLEKRFQSHALAIVTCKNFYGSGFKESNVLAAVSHAKLREQPYLQTLSTIEGGNCYVFFNSKGELKAIVGMHSVILTIIGLEEQGYFENEGKPLIEEFKGQATKPSDQGLRMARNAYLYKQKIPFDKRQMLINRATKANTTTQNGDTQTFLNQELEKAFGGREGYLMLLRQPLSESDKETYHKEGIEWDAKFYVSQVVIARELGVSSLKDIAFVKQEDFHIDMYMFMDPTGDSVYVDENFKEANDTIQSIGCNVVTLSGVVSILNRKINCMNGISLATPSGPIFITNGGGKSQGFQLVYQIFKEELLKKSKYQDVIFLEAMQELIEESEGGLHCLTWEDQDCKNATPIDRIQSYLADDRPFLMNERRNILIKLLRLN